MYLASNQQNSNISKHLSQNNHNIFGSLLSFGDYTSPGYTLNLPGRLVYVKNYVILLQNQTPRK